MEKRIGVVAVLVETKDNIPRLNTILSRHGDIILARQGLPLREKGIQVISLIVEGTTDQTGALTGEIGKIPGVKVKSLLTQYREEFDEPEDRKNKPAAD